MTSRHTRATVQAGFALIVALLALMLLTFLGLTLATTTSTELQVATNYRWGQQALYNAEAGLEVTRAVLAQIGDGQLVLPPARAISWTSTTPVNPAEIPAVMFPAVRNFENSACDLWGHGAGFGHVLVDPTNPATPYENLTGVFGPPPAPQLSGDFTVWIRRDLVFNVDGTISDSPQGESVIVTSEGSAPFTGGQQSVFSRTNRAIRRLESRVSIREGCKPSGPQASQTGFSDCELLP